ncbi:ATP-grasp domain-containing protein [Kitasatospora acidiphila]|uniref:ATP-grasp domain-containing protein n=1 Tax=Kitasatospora acidiphila TaxID=2567942 RepID=UPI001C680407|nr:ATP-grasp domain-containing protein [Kitasatospora acidiphila]
MPRFAHCQSVEQSLAFARSCGYPVIVKPVDGAASIGVHRLEDEASLVALLPELELARYEIEEFVTGDVHHVDGFAGQYSEVRFQAVSRYVNDCLAFAAGAPLGSVPVQRCELRERIEDFSRRCVAALGIRTTPFHLELFVTPEGELVFLEIGGRVGGSEVPHLLNKLFGFNLFEVWLRAAAGEEVALPASSGDPSGAGWSSPSPRGRSGWSGRPRCAAGCRASGANCCPGRARCWSRAERTTPCTAAGSSCCMTARPRWRPISATSSRTLNSRHLRYEQPVVLRHARE